MNRRKIKLFREMIDPELIKDLELDKISEPKETRWISKKLKMMKKDLDQKYRKRLTITTKLINLQNVMGDIIQL